LYIASGDPPTTGPPLLERISMGWLTSARMTPSLCPFPLSLWKVVPGILFPNTSLRNTLRRQNFTLVPIRASVPKSRLYTVSFFFPLPGPPSTAPMADFLNSPFSPSASRKRFGSPILFFGTHFIEPVGPSLFPPQILSVFLLLPLPNATRACLRCPRPRKNRIFSPDTRPHISFPVLPRRRPDLPSFFLMPAAACSCSSFPSSPRSQRFLQLSELFSSPFPSFFASARVFFTFMNEELGTDTPRPRFFLMHLDMPVNPDLVRIVSPLFFLLIPSRPRKCFLSSFSLQANYRVSPFF